MKTVVLNIAIILLVIVFGCTQEDPMSYQDISRVQMKDTARLNYSFVFEPASVEKGVVYIQVNTIGDMMDYDREVKLVQIPEYDYTYVRDPETNLVIDTIMTEKPNKAMPGVHYMALDDPSVVASCVIKANTVTAQIPITLLRHPDLEKNDFRLRVMLVPSKDFEVGETKAVARTIIFADRLVQPAFWASNIYSFGTYGTVKHQFMIDALGENIDDEWYATKVQPITGAVTQYKNLLGRLLKEFNEDPANILSGKAPLKEANETLVTFPA